MSVPLQAILEPVFTGTFVFLLLVVFLFLLTGGRIHRLARWLGPLFFNPGAEAPARETGEPPTTETNPSDPLRLISLFVTLALVALIYSLGILVERTSDALKDGPAKMWWLPGRTDGQIKLDTFREKFQDEWPETDLGCLPYSGTEITNVYYTANNLLKQSSPAADELGRMLRRIHFSESMSVSAAIGFNAFFPLYFLLLIAKPLCRWYRHLNMRPLPEGTSPSAGLPAPRKSDPKGYVQETLTAWARIRARRVLVIVLSLGILCYFANLAWELDEESYDSRVYGYYLAKLELSTIGGAKLSRGPAEYPTGCVPESSRLDGAPGMKRYDASGVSYIQPAVVFDDPKEGVLWRLRRRKAPLRLLVVNDKEPYLNIHSLEGRLVARVRIPGEDNTIEDLEEVARAPDGSYFLLASHSTLHQKPRASRQRLLHVRVTGTYHPDGRESYRMAEIPGEGEVDIKGHLASTCVDDAGEKCLLHGWEEGPDCCEINIEGMAVSRDGGSLLLGFREPLFCNDKDSKDKRLSPIYRLDLSEHRKNPNAPLTLIGCVPAFHSDPAFKGPQRVSGLALGGGGRNAPAYWILTSYEADDKSPGSEIPSPSGISTDNERLRKNLGGALWRWEGTSLQDRPVLVSVTAFHKPEGIVVEPVSGKRFIVFDEDDPSASCSGVPYALLARSDLPERPIHTICPTLLPARSSETP